MAVREVHPRSALARNACASAPFRWTLNPYRGCAHGCVYCFARSWHPRLGLDPGEGFSELVLAKVGVGAVLRRELARPGWRREHVAVGTSADPYQPAEKRLALLPDVWRALRDARTPASVMTRSPLVLRDAALLRAAGAGVCLSVPTLDEEVWRATEPHTPHPRSRLEAVAELRRLGVPAGVIVAPLMPEVNDDPRAVQEVLEAAAQAGAVSVGGSALFLRGPVRELVLAWLRERRPDLVERYEELYPGGRAYLRPHDRRRVEGALRSLAPCDGGFAATPALPASEALTLF